ncbi:LLM class flavin-dependent oxidoreductase [Streptomyces sp. NPDC008079]|uniref:LLM class flavin-dependent oxidoreductase n=1 Tax=Streptomyces sp. NPDC008079 TaxID=3364806 RepID=UPI0036E38DAC
MRISISVAHDAWPEGPRGSARQLERVVATADEIGLDTVWVTDHLTRTDPTRTDPTRTDPTRSPDEAVLEAYATLGLLASRSERVRLGAMASPVGNGAAGPLITAVTTLDVLSGGRAWLGIGAGYADHQSAALGPPAPGAPERFERMEDVLRLAHRMWSGDDSPFRGAHCDLARPYASPLPLSGPHPPVLIGGNGEARMLPLVARYADACNLLDVPNGGATIRRKLDILAVHCRKIGRPLGDIDTSVSVRLRPQESADELVAHCRHFAGLGIGHVVLVPGGPWTEASTRTLAAALPAVRGLHREEAAGPKAARLDTYRAPAFGGAVPV